MGYPLIARYVTAKWSHMLTESAAGIPADERMLLLGLMMYEADPEVVNATIENMPPDVRPPGPSVDGQQTAEVVRENPKAFSRTVSAYLPSPD
jgi:hypothetical protein